MGILIILIYVPLDEIQGIGLFPFRNFYLPVVKKDWY